MFLCGNICNNYQEEPEIVVNNLHTISNPNNLPLNKSVETVGSSTVMIKKSKYLQYLQNCKKNNTPFVDE
jgi:hypothetical protein